MPCTDAPNGIAAPHSALLPRLGRLLFCLICIDSLPVFAAAVLAWLAGHMAMGLYQDLLRPGRLPVHDILGCGAYIAVLSLLVCLASAQVLSAMLFAWRGSSSK